MNTGKLKVASKAEPSTKVADTLRSARYAPHLRTFLDVGFRVIAPDMPTVSRDHRKRYPGKLIDMFTNSTGDQQGGSTLTVRV